MNEVKIKELFIEQLRKTPIIQVCAEKLGVSRMHLWAVLRGRRFSPGLLARYQQLKLSERTA